MTKTQTKHAICHYCGVSCGVKAEIATSEQQQRTLVGLIGNKDNPVYHGFSCAKGRELPNQLSHPNRLLHPLRRNAKGEYIKLDSDSAIAEIADRLHGIIDQHGPNAVALYNGTYSLVPVTALLSSGFMQAIGSAMTFSSATIDQPGKAIASALHGFWRGGAPAFAESDAWLLLGTNPEISKLGGIPAANPAYHLHRARKNGLKLIVIDPRETEAARKAHIHLQPKPGTDPLILAGMIRLILDEQLHDREFLDANADGLEALKQTVEPFTPEIVASQADIDGDQLIAAARLFASANKASANAGTGVNMAPRGTLTEYLLLCLLTICGHWARAGDPVANPGVLTPRAPAAAQASEPMAQAWGFPPFLRSGYGNTMSGLPTGLLADEIIQPGEGQIRALICIGGNPMMAWPDQIKTQQAMEALDLLVVVDPRFTETASFADYVLAPKLSMEGPSCSLEAEALQLFYSNWGYPAPYAMYSPTIVDPPEGSDLVDDWYFFYRLAQEMQLDLVAKSGVLTRPFDPQPIEVPLDMQQAPGYDDLLEIITHGSRVPLSEVKRYPQGHIFDDEAFTVLPKEENCTTRLSIGNEAMIAELSRCDKPAFDGDEQFAFRLISRRMPNFLNSQGRDLERLTRKGRYNPAFMNPEDMRRQGLKKGEVIEIAARRASILGIVEPEPGLKAGVISMAHSFGAAPDEDADDPLLGGNTGRLSSSDIDYVEAVSGIPRMSAIPVNIRKSLIATG